MAFPSVRDSSTGTETSNTTDWDVTCPATVESGDLLLLVIGCDGGSITFSNFQSGWSQLKTLSDGTCSLNVWTKLADGTEDGSLIGTGTGSTITCSGSEQGAWRMTAIQSWWGTVSTGVEVSTGATGSGTGPDPDSLTASWGTADTLWRAVGASDGSVSITAYPANYTLNQFADHSGGGAGAGAFAAGRNWNTNATQDPGTFTLSGAGDGWACCTIAIRPGTGGTTYDKAGLGDADNLIGSGSRIKELIRSGSATAGA